MKKRKKMEMTKKKTSLTPCLWAISTSLLSKLHGLNIILQL
jgi:hypothetical protein